MAAEVRVGHIRVSDTASGNGVGHGRLGYRGVYGSVMCPWFVKGRKSALDYPMAKVPRPTMHNSQCGSIHRKAGWCTKEPSDGVWYRGSDSGVPTHHLVAFGTPDRAFRYGNADVTRGPHNSEARSFKQKGFCTKSTYSVRNEIRCRFVQHYRRFVKVILKGGVD